MKRSLPAPTTTRIRPDTADSPRCGRACVRARRMKLSRRDECGTQPLSHRRSPSVGQSGHLTALEPAWGSSPGSANKQDFITDSVRSGTARRPFLGVGMRTAYQNRKYDPRPGTRSCGASTNACPLPPSAIGLQRSAGRRGYCPVRVVGTGQGLRRTERRTERRTGSANRSADRRKNFGQRIVFMMSLSFRISAIVVIEAGRQDRPDFRSSYLNRMKNKSLISHGIGQ